MDVFDPVSIDEHDLQKVLTKIKAVSKVESLGKGLGLLMSAIDVIQKEFVRLEEQKIEIIKYWLKRINLIHEMQPCPPTWSQLADAVADEDSELSDHIRCKYYSYLLP